MLGVPAIGESRPRFWPPAKGSVARGTRATSCSSAFITTSSIVSPSLAASLAARVHWEKAVRLASTLRRQATELHVAPVGISCSTWGDSKAAASSAGETSSVPEVTKTSRFVDGPGGKADSTSRRAFWRRARKVLQLHRASGLAGDASGVQAVALQCALGHRNGNDLLATGFLGELLQGLRAQTHGRWSTGSRRSRPSRRSGQPGARRSSQDPRGISRSPHRPWSGRRAWFRPRRERLLSGQAAQGSTPARCRARRAYASSRSRSGVRNPAETREKVSIVVGCPSTSSASSDGFRSVTLCPLASRAVMRTVTTSTFTCSRTVWARVAALPAKPTRRSQNEALTRKCKTAEVLLEFRRMTTLQRSIIAQARSADSEPWFSVCGCGPRAGRGSAELSW